VMNTQACYGMEVNAVVKSFLTQDPVCLCKT
jgi:hypothetical protein